LRVVWAAAVPVAPVSDSRAYDAGARTLAKFNVYGWTPGNPTAYWPVGTSFVYSVLYRIFGEGYGSIVILNIVVGVITTLLILELSTRWFGPRAGVIAGLLFACWPSQIEFTTLLASELPFNFCILASLFFWNHRRTPTWADAAMTGIALAAASYVRPLALLLPAVFVLWTLRRGNRGKTIGRAALAAAVMFVLILPWTIRNDRVFGSPVLVSTNGGANLWMGNNPESMGYYMETPPMPADMNEAQFDKHLGDIAKRYIREHPGLFVKRCFRRIEDLFDRETIGVGWNSDGLKDSPLRHLQRVLKIVSTGYWLVMLLGGIVGAGMLISRGPFLPAILHPANLMWAYFTAVHVVTVSNDRYHFPSIPFIAALAGFAAARLLGKQRR
jgi:4-amino-4-deoxy-L-arabinose transferase-like glycosyltransferase